MFGITAALLFLLVVSCSWEETSLGRKTGSTYEVVTIHTSDDSESSYEMHSMMPALSLDELGDMTDLVVLGEVVSVNAIQKTREDEDFGGTYSFHLEILDVKVSEYFRGSGPEIIRVASFDTEKHPTAPKVEQGQAYALYLNQWKAEEDREFFEYAYYLGLGHQGVWEIEGNTAVQQLVGKTAKLDDLRDAGARGFDHEIRDFVNYMQKARLLSRDLTLSTDELSAISDAIVRGTPVGEAAAKKNPEYPSGYPADMKAQDAALLDGVKVFSFNVEQYYKGDGPSTVNIFTDGSAEYPFIDETAAYVLYLHEADFEAARAYYDDAYVIVAAGQGAWIVNDGKAVQQSGAGESVKLNDLESR